MFSRVIHSTAFWALVVLAFFNALSACAGGIAVTFFADGMGMPISLLAGGPFSSYLVPGLILFTVVGGTQLVSAVLLIMRRESALLWSAIAGLGMVIWIFVEVMIIGGGALLQTLYFVTGFAQVVCVLALVGLVSRLPRTPLLRAKS